MKKLIFITLVAISLFSLSCTKETGGNADMLTIDFDVQQSDWFAIGDYGFKDYGYAVDLTMPEITDNVIQDGMVTLYRKKDDKWTPVPGFYYDEGYQSGYLYFMKRGLFSIEYYESDHFTEHPGTQIFRLVIVQPK